MASIYIQSGICPAGPGGYGDYAYFGLNSNTDEWKRLNDHWTKLKKGQHTNESVQDFFNLYGEDSFYRAVVIECDEYYLNTLERAYIYHGNSNQKFNPEGWNHSAGGERAKRRQIPFSFVHGEDLHRGNDLHLFLTRPNMPDPGGFIQLLGVQKRSHVPTPNMPTFLSRFIDIY